MSQISVNNLTFGYEGSFDNVFENVSFQLDTDWKLGFVGRNGRGKTTFLKLLMNEYSYSGKIISSVKFDYFPFEVKNPDMLTLHVLEEINPCFDEWEIQKEASLLCLDSDVLYRPFGALSNGEQTKALLAVMFLKQNNFLLIDEPTNHLDAQARKVVGEYLKSKKGFILVSHDRDFLDSCIDHILSINKTDIVVEKGNYSSYQHNKDLKDGFEKTENEKLKKDISRLNAAARRAGSWSDKTESGKKGAYNSGLRVDTGFVGHKSAKMMKRAKSIEQRREKAADEKSKLLKNTESSEKLAIKPLEYHSETLLEMKDLSVSYDGEQVLSHLSFFVKGGDRLLLKGKNGCGKSTVLKLITENLSDYTGMLKVGSGIVLSYVPQDCSHLQGSLRDFAAEKDIDESLFKTILRKFDFSRELFEKDMSLYSAGQKKKVVLAQSLSTRAHIYLWDEPLNYVDLLSRLQMEDLIKEFSPTMIFVEHDSAFCRSIATRIIEL